METVLIILVVQGLLGGADNLFHHELQAKLPARASARRELALHAAREAIYGIVFLALAWTVPTGLWAWALAGLLAAEIAVTGADFLEEDRTRQLPPAERILHLVLAVAYGVFLAALAPHLVGWIGQPTGVALTEYGLLSWVLTLFGIGVTAWSVRNFAAVLRAGAGAGALPAGGRWGGRRLRRAPSPALPRFGGGRRTAAVQQTMGAPALPVRANDCDPVRTTLVTGGTGFVGFALVRALAGAGERVIVLSRDLRQARAQFGAGFGDRVVAVDRLDMLPAETRIDAVVDLAGAPVLGPPWTKGRKRTLVRSRVDITAQVVALIRRLERRPEVLVGASAIGFYGVDGDAPVDESAPSQQDFAARLCQAREAATAEAETLGVRCVMLRLAIVLGRGGGVLPPMALMSRLGLGAVLGDGRQAMPWIHLDDAVGLIRHVIADAGLSGPVNAVAPDTPSQAEFAQTLAGACGRVARMRVPARLLRLLLGEQAGLLLRGRPVLPAKALASGYRFRFAALAPALRMLCTDSPGSAGAAQRVRGDEGGATTVEGR